MTIDAETLQRMITQDELGLLEAPIKATPLTRDDRLLGSFREIQAFVRENAREPASDSDDVGEATLAFRLEAMRANPEHRLALAEIDEAGILAEPEPPETLEDAVAHDPLGLLDTPGENLHALQHVPKTTTTPDEIAQRRRCEDFDLFEPLFKTCQQELRAGSRKLVPFKNEQGIGEGTFYVLRGVLAYVATEGERRKEHGRVNARLRCIFENGTEADLLLRSLASQLYRFGRGVTEPQETTGKVVIDNLGGELGHVYVLRSLSEDPQVRAIPDLHKIGYTVRDPKARVSGAESSTTFLGAAVEEARTYEMPKAVGRTVEGLLHTFFSAARLDIWFERGGVTEAEAREWFSVPIAVIDEAIDLINSRGIQNYEYDADRRQIVLRT